MSWGSAPEPYDLFQASKGFIGGTLAGMAGCFVGHPFDTVKVYLQTQERVNGVYPYKGPIDCTLKIIRNEGAASLFKGVLPPLLGGGAITSACFGGYDHACNLISYCTWNTENGPRRYQHNIDQLSMPQIFLAGMLGGIPAVLVTSPLELVKTQLQVQIGNGQQNGKPGYKGTFDCIRKIVQNRGIKGLFQGVGATGWRDIPGYGTYFAGYELSRRLLSDDGKKVAELSAPKQFLAGGIGGITGWLFVYPLDVIKSRIQAESSQRKYTSTLDCAIRTWREGGIRVFFVGLGTTLFRAFPVNAATFFVYEAFIQVVGQPNVKLNSSD